MAAITSAVQGFDLPDTWRRKRIKYVATYVSVRPDRYPFHRHGSRSSTFVIL